MKRILFMALLLTCSAALFASCGPTKDWHLSEQCSKFLNERYANARILDVDYDKGMVDPVSGSPRAGMSLGEMSQPSS